MDRVPGAVMPNIQVGHTIGNYKITAKLGEGGMGVVYLAEHPVLGRKVALKAIHPELSRNPEVVSRFFTEARSVNQIGNDHIVDISDFGNTPDGEYYFIMEFLQGESLADRLKREHLFPAPRALQIASQVADALAASHRHGIIHRDLKPENIFLINRGNSPDFVKVLDFGLAKLTQGEEKVSHKTRTGSVMGTPYYMSPEQCEGKANIDQRADLYSLGVILFEMMTGNVPFGGEGYGEIIVKHITQPPPSARALNPRLSVAQERVLMRALEKNREDRFAGMDEFREAMLDPEKYAAGTDTKAVTLTMGGLGRSPRGPISDEVSGQVVFGGVSSPGTRAIPLPAVRGSDPLDDDLAPPRSRKGLIAVVVLAVVGAAVAAVLVAGKGSHPAPVVEPVKPAPAVAVSPPVAPDPQTVEIVFASTPPGATVTRMDTGKALGTTPVTLKVPFGKSPVPFLFRKEGFSDQTVHETPNIDDHVSAVLVPKEAAAPPPVVAEPTKAVPAPRGATKKASSGKAHRGPQMPTDEDTILQPKF